MSSLKKLVKDTVTALEAEKAAEETEKDLQEEERTIRDGMDIADVERILKDNYGKMIVYWHDGGRFELTGAVLYENAAAPEGMDSVPFGSTHVICAEFGRGVLGEDGGAVR